jgi:nitrous oxide reductase accessory protein NosL
MNSPFRSRRVLVLLASAVVAGPLGCSHKPALGPPEIHLNQDTCHECGMTVSDARHAAAVVVLRDGVEETYVFDDTGEMIDFTPPDHCTEVRRYAHDFPTGRWFDAAALRFVRDRGLHTPMDTGVVAYAEPAAADAAGRRRGAQALSLK